MDQDLLSALDISLAQQIQRDQRPIRDDRRFLIGHIARLDRDHPAFRHTHILGVGPHLVAEMSKHLVARTEQPHLVANGFDLACELVPEDSPFGLIETKRYSPQEPHRQRHIEVSGGDRAKFPDDEIPEAYGCCVYLDQDFVCLRGRLLHLSQLKNFGGSVLCVNDRLHEFPPRLI